MRGLILTLLVSVAIAAPSNNCLDDLTKCQLSDFELDPDAPPQCVPHAYDLKNPTGPFGADVGNRQECSFWDWCIPNGNEYVERNIMGNVPFHIGKRTFTSGSKCGPDQNEGCVELIQEAYLYKIVDGKEEKHTPMNPVFTKAIEYYNNQDYCRVSWFGVIFWPVSIVAGLFIVYWVVEALRLMVFEAKSTIFGTPFENTILWGDQSKGKYQSLTPGRKKRDLV